MLMMVFTGPVFGQVCHRSAARVMPAVRYGVRLELMVQTDAGHAHKTLSRSCLVQKRKNSVSRGADHFAALRGPFPPGVPKVSWASFRPPCPWERWSRPGVVVRPSEAAGGAAYHYAGGSSRWSAGKRLLRPLQQEQQCGIVPSVSGVIFWVYGF